MLGRNPPGTGKECFDATGHIGRFAVTRLMNLFRSIVSWRDRSPLDHDRTDVNDSDWLKRLQRQYKLTEKGMSDEPIPLVIVEGFLGSPGAICWGAFERYLNKGCGKKRRVLFARVGPVSSLHDRACELYYVLKGGPVDYGQKHSEENGHARFGRIENGLYPDWSQERPLHFLGHSMGGPTITKLQWLLGKGHFGPEGSPGMILSLTSISSPFRGTQLVYLLGERTDAAPLVQPLSVGSLLAKWAHLVSYISPLLPSFLDLRTEARRLTYEDISVGKLMCHLWRSDWAEGRDATPFDATFEAADKRENENEGHPWKETFYLSHVACTKGLKSGSIVHRLTPSLPSLIFLPFNLTASLIEKFDLSRIQPVPSFLEDVNSEDTGPTGKGVQNDRIENDAEKGLLSASLIPDSKIEHLRNDGVVPLFSQFHPLSCGATRCMHHEGTDIYDFTKGNIKPGIWGGKAKRVLDKHGELVESSR